MLLKTSKGKIVTYSLICVLCFCLGVFVPFIDFYTFLYFQCFQCFLCFLCFLFFLFFLCMQNLFVKKKIKSLNCPNNLIYITTAKKKFFQTRFPSKKFLEDVHIYWRNTRRKTSKSSKFSPVKCVFYMILYVINCFFSITQFHLCLMILSNTMLFSLKWF